METDLETGKIYERCRPLSRKRAKEVLANGHDGFGTGSDGVKDYRQLLTREELVRVQEYFLKEAPGSWSFNDVIRKCSQ